MTCADIKADELLTVSEAAERFKIRPATIYKWIEAKAIPAIYVGPTKETRVRVSDLVSDSR